MFIFWYSYFFHILVSYTYNYSFPSKVKFLGNLTRRPSQGSRNNNKWFSSGVPGRTNASTITASRTLFKDKKFFSYIESMVTVFGSFVLRLFFLNCLINSSLFFGAPTLRCSLQAFRTKSSIRKQERIAENNKVKTSVQVIRFRRFYCDIFLLPTNKKSMGEDGVPVKVEKVVSQA